MPTNVFTKQKSIKREKGVTLIEVVVFIVVISVGLGAMVAVFTNYLSNSVDPLVQLRALECAQSKLEEILARKFDENSPTGGVPACGSAEQGAVACLGIQADAGYDDVGDFNNQADTDNVDCTINVMVVNAGTDLGIANDQARLITVNVNSRGGGNSTLAAYKTNF